MCCSKCKNEIPSNASFCPICGKRIKKEISKEKKKEIQKIYAQGALGCFITVIVVILVMIILGTSVLCIINPDFKESIFRKKASNKDITTDYELNTDKSNLIELNIIIHANCDIKDLEVNIEYYDKDYELIRSVSKKIGSMEKGDEIKRTINITDIPITKILEIEYVKITVNKGTVSRFS